MLGIWGQHSRSVNSSSIYSKFIDFIGEVSNERGCAKKFPLSGGPWRLRCRPTVWRFLNEIITALITSAFVPGLFLRRIVGPSAIFILPGVTLGTTGTWCARLAWRRSLRRHDRRTRERRFVPPRWQDESSPVLPVVVQIVPPDEMTHAHRARPIQAWRKKWILYFKAFYRILVDFHDAIFTRRKNHATALIKYSPRVCSFQKNEMLL